MKTDDILLIAYVDGDLPSQDRQEVEKEIGESAEVAERVALLQASRLPYREAFAHQKLPPVPESLTKKIQEMTRAALEAENAKESKPAVNDAVLQHDSTTPPSAPVRSRMRHTPAWLAVAFVAGAFCYGVVLRFMPGVVPGLDSSHVKVASRPMGASPWVQAAANYQQLYSRETVDQLPPDDAGSAQTVADIRKQDGLALRVPDLHAEGLTFKRVQRLRFHGKPLVQIVYLPEKGAPISLCVVKDPKPDQALSQQNVDTMDVVTWRQGELSYALIGTPGNVDLQAVGKQIADSGVSDMFGQGELPAKG
jgi:anti-sigma factor RsiW